MRYTVYMHHALSIILYYIKSNENPYQFIIKNYIKLYHFSSDISEKMHSKCSYFGKKKKKYYTETSTNKICTSCTK